MKSEISNYSEYDLKEWLIDHIADYVQLTPLQIKSDVPLAEFGLDSVYALTLAGEIEDYLGIVVESTLLWDFPTIDSLTEALIQRCNKAGETSQLQQTS